MITVMPKTFHPIAAATRDAALAVRPTPDGLRTPGSTATVVPVRVSKSVIPRMTRVLDELLRAAERRGYVIGADQTYRQGHGPRPAIVIRGTQVTFNVTEGMTRTGHNPDAQDEGNIARGHDFLVRRYDNVPNGQLRLAVTNQYSGRTRWADRQSAALEDLIEDILDGMDAHARREEEREAEREVEREHRRQE